MSVSIADELFSKRLPVTVKAADRDDRKVFIQVTVEMHTITAPSHRKELLVRLTDESDLFFLYTLRLSEEDFQCLKSQQGLLVDFGAFPQRFIELLRLVLQEEHKDVPKFILDFICSGGALGSATGTLNVIETNPFKHLTHLALKFLPGTDTDVKKFLADCLKTLKDQNADLLHKFEHTEGELSSSLRQAREALSSRTQELDALKAEWSARTTNLSAQHSKDISSEKEKALQSQAETQQRYEREKRDIEQNYTRNIKQLESKLYESETANKDLTDKKYKSEATIRELRSKLSSLEEEHGRTKQELTNLRKSNTGLDANYHQQEKTINQLQTRLAVVEQEVKDKEQVQERTSELLTTTQEQKQKASEELDRRQRQIVKLQLSIKTMTEELVKGNEIIKKLQGEIKNYSTKLKLRNQVTTEQEKLLGEKNKEMEEMRHDLEQQRTKLMHKEDENRKLNESLETTMAKLDESRQLLKTNENVINWLNKQVTDSQLNHHRTAAGAFEMNSTSASQPTSTGYRPALQNYAGGQSYTGSMRMSTTGVSSMSPNSIQSAPPYHPQPRQPHVHYQPGVGQMRKNSSLPVPLDKSSPMGLMPSVAEELPNMHASPLLVNPSPILVNPPPTRDPSGLDTKYLQGGGEAVPRVSSLARATSPSLSIHFSDPKPSKSGAGKGDVPSRTHLSRDSMAHGVDPQTGSVRPKTSQPPLASVYFPSKVS